MSVFEASTTEQENTQKEETTTTSENTNEDWLQKVVSEKGEHWQSPDVLAKGYAHAQARIKELEDSLKESSKNDYAKELLERLQKEQSTPSSTAGTSEDETKGSSEKEKTTLDPDELQSLIDKALTQREQSNTKAQNLKDTNTKLEEAYGTEAKTVVQEKAKELGMSLSKLEEIAAESPTAFLRLIGEPQSQSTSTPRSTVNTAAGFTAEGRGERNFKFYQDIRRKNRSEYNSARVQKQMFEDAKRLGAKFYQ